VVERGISQGVDDVKGEEGKLGEESGKLST
jgi:hypothetical protein